MLFVASKVTHVRSPRDASAAYWSWLQAELHDVGLDLFVVLIPSKYTVYRPLLADRGTQRHNEQTFLDRLEHELTASNVPVVNLTAALSREAAERAPGHEYLYWRDDIHWNRKGIQLAASAILRHPAIAKVVCDAHRTTTAVAQSPATDY
jgi:hypothetical protein